MKKLILLITVLFLLTTASYAKEAMFFTYGTQKICDIWEELVREYNNQTTTNSTIKVYCFKGNPYEGASGLKLISKLKPSIIAFPASLYDLFGPMHTTGSCVDLSHVSDLFARGTYALKIMEPNIYAGIWAGAPDKEHLVNFLLFLKEKAPVISSNETIEADIELISQWQPSGWWAQKLENVEWINPETLIKPPFNYMKKVYIKRYEVDDLYPQKAFVVEFNNKTRVLSTVEGFKDVVAVANVYIYPEMWGKKCSLKEHIEKSSKALGFDTSNITMLFTGADMDNIAFAMERFENIKVWVAATAGVFGNAMRTGVDKGNYIEKNGKWEKVGTINILLFTNCKLTDGAMASAIIRITEAKTSVLEDLHINSTFTPNVQATGTSTDNIIVVGGNEEYTLTTAAGYSKFGELIGKAVRRALFKALYKQNGIQKIQ